MSTSTGYSVYVVSGAYTAFADYDCAGRQMFREALCDRQVCLEGVEVTVVDANNFGVCVQC